MITLKDSTHIRTSRNIKSRRTALPSTGISQAQHDAARIVTENQTLALRKNRRLWLNKQWRKRLTRLG